MAENDGSFAAVDVMVPSNGHWALRVDFVGRASAPRCPFFGARHDECLLGIPEAGLHRRRRGFGLRSVTASD